MFDHINVSNYEELARIATLLMNDRGNFKHLLFDANGQLRLCVQNPMNFLALEKIFNLLDDSVVRDVVGQIEGGYFNKFLPNQYLLEKFICNFPRITKFINVRVMLDKKKHKNNETVAALRTVISSLDFNLDKWNEVIVKPATKNLAEEVIAKKSRRVKKRQELISKIGERDDQLLKNWNDTDWYRSDINSNVTMQYFISCIANEIYTPLSHSSQLLYLLEKYIVLFPQVLPFIYLIDDANHKAKLATILIKAAVNGDQLSRHYNLSKYLTRLCEYYLLPFKSQEVRKLMIALQAEKSPYAGLFQLFTTRNYNDTPPYRYSNE